MTKADFDGLTDPDERRPARLAFSRRRQAIETVFNSLTDRLALKFPTLKFPRARSKWGVWLRLAATVAAFNLAVFVNCLCQRPTLSRFNPFH